jgi:hypothetical protein
MIVGAIAPSRLALLQITADASAGGSEPSDFDGARFLRWVSADD